MAIVGASLSACGKAARGEANAGDAHNKAATATAPPQRQKIVVEPGAKHKIVARVGRRSITLAYLEEWTPLEMLFASPYKQSSSIPLGYVPDPPSYRDCVAYLAAGLRTARAAERSSEAQLRGLCEHEWEHWVHFTLSHLIKYSWIYEEAARMGVEIAHADVQRLIAESHVKPAVLEALGVPPAYQGYVAGAEAITAKVFTLLPVYKRKVRETREGRRETKRTAIAIDRQFYKFYNGMWNRWVPHTHCDPEWIVPNCSEYEQGGEGPL